MLPIKKWTLIYYKISLSLVNMRSPTLLYSNALITQDSSFKALTTKCNSRCITHVHGMRNCCQLRASIYVH